MSELEALRKFPEVQSAVACDFAGAFHEGFQEPDGEGVAAIIGLVALTLHQAGELLGLGELVSSSISCPSGGRAIVRRGNLLLTANVEPAKALPSVIRALEGGA